MVSTALAVGMETSAPGYRRDHELYEFVLHIDSYPCWEKRAEPAPRRPEGSEAISLVSESVSSAFLALQRSNRGSWVKTHLVQPRTSQGLSADWHAPHPDSSRECAGRIRKLVTHSFLPV